LEVFFDKGGDELDQWLNEIRMNGSKSEVIQAVGLVRGFQIARSYAKRYAPDIKIPLPKMISEQYKKLGEKE